MKACDEMIILTLPGWEASRGVSAEIAYFNRHAKPISHISPDAIEAPCL